MAQVVKPAPKRRKLKDCEACLHCGGKFFKDTVDPNIIRVYCNAWHSHVNVDLMTDNCQHWMIHPDYQKPEEVKNKFGL